MSPASGSIELATPDEVRQLAGAARFFGDLLLFELDAHSLAALREPAAASQLEALGMQLPSVAYPDGPTQPSGSESTDALLDELASEYHAVFLKPEGGGAPPIGSLWTEGRFEGALAARVRELSSAAALDFSHVAAKGSPVDHLGVLMHLWAESTGGRATDVANEIAERHLDWTDAPLRQAAGQTDVSPFYAGLASAVLAFTAVLRSTRVA